MTAAPSVYSRNGCQGCVAVKRWMTQRGIPFSETNVDLISETEADEIRVMLKEDGFQQFPVVYIGDQAFSGFNPGELDKIAEAYK